ncbi:hypothetical protein A0256_06245 [Mucilaginibacter sp. PAMC 26640]|nr:hypothetical protein A0256_06245 [Mucilaginibacter sp. PAMC 26640]
MNLKTLVFLAALLTTGLFCTAQNSPEIVIRLSHHQKTVRQIEFLVDNVMVSVDPDGGVYAIDAGAYNYRDDISTPNGFEQDKPSSIRGTQIEYYSDIFGDYDGNIKRVGSVQITYFDHFGNFDKVGRVKSIGDINFEYYDRFGGFDNIGKLKQVGANLITYYDRYDGQDNLGKIKSIGNMRLVYYDRYDGGNRIGALKDVSGSAPGVRLER